MKASFFVLFLFVYVSGLSQVFAQGRIGNGAHAVVCDEEGLLNVKFFDYWEQRHIDRKAVIHFVNFGGPELSLPEKVEVALKRIRKYDLSIALYIGYLLNYMTENIDSFLVEDTELQYVADFTTSVPLPDHCRLQQLAFQSRGPFMGYKDRIKISRSLFMALNDEERVGVLLHEALYLYAIEMFNANLSNQIREFNYAIATNTLLKFWWDPESRKRSSKYWFGKYKYGMYY